MHVTYRPEDGETQRWEFEPGRVRASEAELIEKRFGASWREFLRDVQAGSLRARRVMLWHLMRREHHTLRWEDTPDFCTDELTVEHTAVELANLREQLVKAPVPDEDREQMLAALDAEYREALERDGDPAGKATSKRGASPA